MNHGKYERRKAPARHEAKQGKMRLIASILSIVLVLTLGIGVTLAYLVANSEPIKNTFTPSEVSCEVTEEFDSETKSNVNVKNTSDIAVYIRVKLVSYRVNEKGQNIGGEATVPEFTLGTGWFLKDGYYYYSIPVAAGESPENPLIGEEGIKLVYYDDVDGGKQVIEVMAEAIQSLPTSVVAEKWNVTVNEDGTLTEGGSVG